MVSIAVAIMIRTDVPKSESCAVVWIICCKINGVEAMTTRKTDPPSDRPVMTRRK